MISSLLDIPSVALYLKRIGARARSLKTAVIEEKSGEYFKELAVIYFTESGEVKCNNEEYLPSASELAAIAEDCKTVQWPRHLVLQRISQLPEELKGVPEEDLFEFKDIEGGIIMIQHRREIKGERSYSPWTFWTDNKWRNQEPNGPLPLWGLPQLKNHTTVFLHEGAGSARYCEWMVARQTADAKKALAEFPWADEIQNAAHLGWTGGAMAPHRTDWGLLKKHGVKRVYIVADNDEPGRAAVPTISRGIRVPTFWIQFTSEWKTGFDLKDPWPEGMFKVIEGRRYYNGPSFKEVVHPATWATDQIPNKKGKPTTVLRDVFKDMWAYIEEVDLFVCTERPEIVRSEKILNNMLSAFSHTTDTTRLMLKSFNGRSPKLCYRPDVKGRLVTNKGTSSINLHVPAAIKAQEGDPKPFLDFIEYMIPKEDERKEILRWCATLIAHPEVRMEYGVLLVSESQGIGKTTLGAAILSPLVGSHNTSFPSESEIVNSEFNGWIAHKRLAVVNEIYSGHSWKAYNQLKTKITDKEVSYNEKFQKSYVIENWCHILACSNSLRALKVESDDRRWLYPEVTEKRWPRQKFVELHAWLAGGGLSIIKYWALQQKDYVLAGERAPMTLRKQELIEGSMTDAQKEVGDLARAMANSDQPLAVTMKDVKAWAGRSVSGVMHDSDYDLRKAMKNGGVGSFTGGRIYAGGRLQYVMVNGALADLVARLTGEDDPNKTVNKYVKNCNDILATVM